MKGYKGFNKGLTCHGKQYAENTVFEEETAEIGKSGMHFCESPLDVIMHYGFIDSHGEFNEFAEVEALDECMTNNNVQYVTKKLKIGSKINITELVKAFVDFTFKKIDFKNSAATNTGDRSVAINKGDRSAATNKGYCSAATNTGKHSAATNTGNRSAATNAGKYSATTNTGNCSAATNTGNYSVATNTGECSVAIAMGDYSASTNTGACSAAMNEGMHSVAVNTGSNSVATNTGNCSVATNRGWNSVAMNSGNFSVAVSAGDYSSSTVEGKESIAIATGIESKAKGKKGCYIAVAEWALAENGHYVLADFQTRKVDGEIIKEDTFYTLMNGEFIEVNMQKYYKAMPNSGYVEAFGEKIEVGDWTFFAERAEPCSYYKVTEAKTGYKVPGICPVSLAECKRDLIRLIETTDYSKRVENLISSGCRSPLYQES